MKSARAASAAVAEEFDELDGGWMSPTAATCMTPPVGGAMVVVARGMVVVTAGAVVVAPGTVVLGSDDVVVLAVGTGCVSITSCGGVAVSRLANRPAASWL